MKLSIIALVTLLSCYVYSQNAVVINGYSPDQVLIEECQSSLLAANDDNSICSWTNDDGSTTHVDAINEFVEICSAETVDFCSFE